ncbi:MULTISPECIES: hypothetical protein [Bacillaceae]|uniref:hypothetical protein n=1 Tax=Bacillaceae TaxID=186817 RepID=UPI0029643FED|nr:hypothetical protein [Bacillus infantis]MDW2879698.1 hypothetical protein [Bacillus infantis]
MKKSILILITCFTLFSCSPVQAETVAEGNNIVKIFDIEKNQVINTIPSNPNVQIEIQAIIKGIDGVVKKFNPIPTKGYMIKIPLEQPYLLENKWINAYIDEVIIIIPIGDDPYLVTYDDENNPQFFTINTKINELLQILGVSL